MKLEKLITLSINYENINIENNIVLFKIERYLENKLQHINEGLTTIENWDNFLKNPFEFIIKPINDNYYFCLIDENHLTSYPSFDDICLGENNNLSLIGIPSENKISFDLVKNNLDKKIFIYDSIITQNSSHQDNSTLHILKNLDNTLAYWQPGFKLPLLSQSNDNLPIFENLLFILKNYPDYFSLNDNLENNNEIIQKIEDGIYEIKNPYIPDENDFSAPYPSIDSSLGFLKFKPINYSNFDKIFNIAKQHIHLNDCISSENFALIINLALLKISFPNTISEEFYKIFEENNKKANLISLDFKLAEKNFFTKKSKI